MNVFRFMLPPFWLLRIRFIAIQEKFLKNLNGSHVHAVCCSGESASFVAVSL